MTTLAQELTRGLGRASEPRTPVLTILWQLLQALVGKLAGSAALTVGSLGFGVAGAFTISVTAGLFAICAAGLILEWALQPDGQPS